MLYDDLGRRAFLARSNGVVTYSGYDGASRLASLTHRFPARADMAKSFTYNPAGQIVAEVQSPLGEAYAPPAGPRQAYAANALNQYTQAGGEAVSHNANGAQVARGGRQYSYDSADRLTAVNAVGGASLSYDAAGRLGALLANGLSTRFVYDGGQLTGEVDGNGVMIRRYVPLPGPDETLAMYDSTGVSYPLADSRGTPMAWTLANGQIAVQQYGAFGEEGPANIGRFGFTGQMRLPEIGLDYYKARFYNPSIGRFLTPDPAGTIDSPNLYAYVLNDPINFTDPSGLEAQPPPPPPTPSEETIVTGRRPNRGSFVDSGPCFTIPAFCTYHGGYITPYINPAPAGMPSDTSVSALPVPVAKKSMPKKPKYCSSQGYQVGDFIDGKLGNGIKIAGAGIVLAGGAVGLSTALTGFGAGAGVAIAASGGLVYAAGTAVSTVGNFTKFLSGQGAGPTAAGLLSVPTMSLGPVSQIAADQAMSYFANKDPRLADPCKN